VTTSRSSPLDDGALTGVFVFVAAATLLSVGAVVVTATPGGLTRPDLALAFGAFIALGELARISLPDRRDVAPIATAGSLAYALLLEYGQDEATHGAMQVVTVVTVAMMMGVSPHVVAGRAPAVSTLARRLLAVGFAAVLFRETPVIDLARELRGFSLAMLMIAVVVVTLLVDAVLAAAVRSAVDRAPYLPALRNETSAQLGIGSAIGATGALIALAAAIMGGWALPVFVIPLLLTQFSFRRYAAIRQTYLQTVRALSQVTEIGGYTESGHARRVSDLAVAVGRELGMSDPDLLELEYAALMHDIGQLSLPEPIPGGATVVAAPGDQRRIAALGADVIRQTGVLDGVATIVEQQSEPYRRPHQDADRTVPLASRIIKAVNAYDDLVGDSMEPRRTLDAIERLRLGMAYEYDPRVVDSLSTAVGRSLRAGAAVGVRRG
jgi:hypothetical protein